jgi:isoleucyl-tRNA synthetase
MIMLNEESMTADKMQKWVLSMFSSLEKAIEMATQASKCKGIAKSDRKFISSQLAGLIDFRDSITKDIKAVRAKESISRNDAMYALNRLYSQKEKCFVLLLVLLFPCSITQVKVILML